MHASAPTRLACVSVLASTLALSAAAPAYADSATEKATSKQLVRAQDRRKGFIFGFTFGMGVAGASGYPNDSSKIGVQSYYDGSDVLGGAGGSLFAMYSLSDWLSFGVFYARAQFRSASWYSYGGGGGFRVDLYPLTYAVPALRDLAVFGKFGIGTTTLVPTSGSQELSTGTESYLGGGVFYELLVGKHWGIGPTVEYDAEVTQSNQRSAALFGGRVAFYTGR
jgi:hypothetical protein